MHIYIYRYLYAYTCTWFGRGHRRETTRGGSLAHAKKLYIIVYCIILLYSIGYLSFTLFELSLAQRSSVQAPSKHRAGRDARTTCACAHAARLKPSSTLVTQKPQRPSTRRCCVDLRCSASSALLCQSKARELANIAEIAFNVNVCKIASIFCKLPCLSEASTH